MRIAHQFTLSVTSVHPVFAFVNPLYSLQSQCDRVDTSIDQYKLMESNSRQTKGSCYTLRAGRHNLSNWAPNYKVATGRHSADQEIPRFSGIACSRDSSVSTETRLRTERQGFNSRQVEFFLCGQDMKLATHLHLLPNLRMRGAIFVLSQYAFMGWCLIKHRDNFTFTFTFTSTTDSYHKKVWSIWHVHELSLSPPPRPTLNLSYCRCVVLSRWRSCNALNL
jgi:hypothetical protein